MREFKEVPKVGTDKVLAILKCDICKEKGSDYIGETSIFQHSTIDHAWDTERITVSIEEHCNIPEGSTSRIEFADICPKCFREKVMPFLKSLGVTFQKILRY